MSQKVSGKPTPVSAPPAAMPKPAPKATVAVASPAPKPRAWSPPSATPRPKRDGFEQPDPPPPGPPGAPPAGVAGPEVALPPRTTPQTLHVNGVGIETNGVSQAAVDEAQRIVQQLVTRPDIQKTFAKRKVTLVLIPANQKMTDLPEFASLRGQKTFDGRPWETVRGSGGTSLPDGRLVIGVAEETLADLSGDHYPAGYSVGLHELAHVVQNVGIPSGERQATIAEYNTRKAAGGPFTDTYGSSNYMEDFAQMTCAYFGRNTEMGQNGAAWIQANAPARYALLEKIYGPPPA